MSEEHPALRLCDCGRGGVCYGCARSAALAARLWWVLLPYAVLLELARARTRDASDVQEAIRWRTVRALAQIAYDELPEGVKPNG